MACSRPATSWLRWKTCEAEVESDRTLHCGSLRGMLILLACMVVEYRVLEFCSQAGSSLARCLRFICISERHVRCFARGLPLTELYSESVVWV